MGPKHLARLALGAVLLVAPGVGCESGDDHANGLTGTGAPVATRSLAPLTYIGGVDEVIGPTGPLSPAFDDADFRQLRRPDAILPVYHPRFLGSDESDLPDDELVIGLKINGDARAYPAGLLYNREMVNDTVGGVPVLVTWCPLCYTALVHDRRLNGDAPVFGNQGALYKGAMTWFDHATGSVWSQPLGAAIAGALVGSSLELIPSQLTTWGQWLAANPDSLVLTSDIPAAPYSGRTPGADHVAGVVVGNHAMAWPYLSVLDAGSLAVQIGGIDLVVSADPETGAIRAAEIGNERRQLPVIIAYRWAWQQLYPDWPIDKAHRVQ